MKSLLKAHTLRNYVINNFFPAMCWKQLVLACEESIV